MVWTISETETIKETLRSSMYLAIFVMALGALTSGRQVGPLVDVSVLGRRGGRLRAPAEDQPDRLPGQSIDGVRVDSTLGYANTTAVILGMGVVLALSRMTTLRNPVFRGLYAVLVLSFLVTLYLTLSRGGLGSLGIGLILLFVLGSTRLQMLANLLLVSLPGAWLWWRMQSLDGLLETGITPQEKLADGMAFRNDLILALLVAFALQAGYAFLAEPLRAAARGPARARDTGRGRAVLVACVGPSWWSETAVGRASSATRSTGNVAQRLISLGIGFRGDYWRVGLGGVDGAPLYRHRGRHVPVHLAGGQARRSRASNRSTTSTSSRAPRPASSPSSPSLGFVAVLLGYTGGPPGGRSRRAERRLLLPASSPPSSST